jgi:hypothetical protein
MVSAVDNTVLDSTLLIFFFAKVQYLLIGVTTSLN